MTEPQPALRSLGEAGAVHTPAQKEAMAYAKGFETARDGYSMARADNASLRALVAELTAALERAKDWLASYPGGGTLGPTGPYEQARAALAKAKEGTGT